MGTQLSVQRQCIFTLGLNLLQYFTFWKSESKNCVTLHGNIMHQFAAEEIFIRVLWRT